MQSALTNKERSACLNCKKQVYLNFRAKRKCDRLDPCFRCMKLEKDCAYEKDPVSPLDMVTDQLPPFDSVSPNWIAIFLENCSFKLSNKSEIFSEQEKVVSHMIDNYFEKCYIKGDNCFLHPIIFKQNPYKVKELLALVIVLAIPYCDGNHVIFSKYPLPSAKEMVEPIRKQFQNYVEEQPKIETVQILLLLVATLVHIGGGSVRGWVYLSTALKISHDLKLDVDPDSLPETLSLSHFEKEERRRTWWAVRNGCITNFAFYDLTSTVTIEENRVKLQLDEPQWLSLAGTLVNSSGVGMDAYSLFNDLVAMLLPVFKLRSEVKSIPRLLSNDEIAKKVLELSIGIEMLCQLSIDSSVNRYIPYSCRIMQYSLLILISSSVDDLNQIVEYAKKIDLILQQLDIETENGIGISTYAVIILFKCGLICIEILLKLENESFHAIVSFCHHVAIFIRKYSSHTQMFHLMYKGLSVCLKEAGAPVQSDSDQEFNKDQQVLAFIKMLKHR